MRKFRNAALAATTAVAVSLAGTAISSAQEIGNENQTVDAGNSSTPIFKDDTGYDYFESLSSVSEALSSEGTEESTASSKAATGLGAYGEEGKPETNDLLVRGGDIFGDRVGDNGTWAKVWRDTVVVGLIATVVGGVIAAYNWAAFQGILPTF